MKIQSLSISGVGGIRELELHFHPGFNVLCGPNGIGKTTVLNIIADAFCNSNSVLKRNATYAIGNYTIEYIGKNGEKQRKSLEVKEFEPGKKDHSRSLSDETPYLMLFSINRFINYQEISNLPRDPNLNLFNLGNSLTQGIQITDMKGWFVNRFLFCDKEGSMTEEQTQNYLSAKGSFSAMDPDMKFKTVDSSSYDILLTSKKGDIYFEYLSAGYKTCIYIILGLIKEIEFRFREPRITASDFDGVVLIDEIDLHLHPTWQGRLVEALRQIFPKAQFIVTTHSPSVLQSLNKEEIIAMTQDNSGNVQIKELQLGEYGLQGWTIEEILKDVMEMPDTSSNLYMSTMESYKNALAENNNKDILRNYRILKAMLHPESITGRLLDIQIAGLEDDE